jgi:hypothetical protein
MTFVLATEFGYLSLFDNGNNSGTYKELNVTNVSPFIDLVLLEERLGPFFADSPSEEHIALIYANFDVIEAARKAFDNWRKSTENVNVTSDNDESGNNS